MATQERNRQRYLEEFKPAYDAFIKHYPFQVEDLDGEVWRDIKDYEGLYQISNWGRVKSFAGRWGKETILKPLLNHEGYLCVGLYKGGKYKRFRINRLVAEAFIPNPENKPQVDHRFGMKFDNSAENLRWATSSENQQYAYEAGLELRKLTNEQVICIRSNPEGLTTCQLAEKFRVSQRTISKIQLGKSRKAAGGQIRGKVGTHKLNEIQRAEIRKLYATGEYSQRKLGKKFGVCQRTICKIIHEK